MNPETKWEKTLAIVAWTLIAGSGLSLLGGIVGSFFCDRLMVNLGDLLIILAAKGVLGGSGGWRRFLIFCLWLGLIGFSLILSLWPRVTISPPVPAPVRTAVFCGILAQTILYAVSLFVLLLPKVKALFPDSPPPAAGE